MCFSYQGMIEYNNYWINWAKLFYCWNSVDRPAKIHAIRPTGANARLSLAQVL